MRRSKLRTVGGRKAALAVRSFFHASAVSRQPAAVDKSMPISVQWKGFNERSTNYGF